VETVFDIACLLLLIPSFCLWVRRARNVKYLQSLLTIACLVVLLFPVVSASDDLRAAAADFEDIAPTKKFSEASASPKCGYHHARNHVILSSPLSQHGISDWMWNLESVSSPVPFSLVLDVFRGRGPPSTFSSIT
jgi:hypothetical protein